MDFSIVFKIAFRELKKNKLRTSLTSVGIIIGVAAVISTVSLTQGAKKLIEQQFLSLGGKSLIVKRGTRTKSGVRKVTNKIKLTNHDVKTIKQLDIVEYASPIINATEYIISGNTSRFTALVGTSVDFFYINNWFAKSGNIFSTEDIKNSETVCLLGKTVSDNLFGFQNPVGKQVRISNYKFTVIGVLSSIGQTSSGRDQDDAVIIPYTTMQKRIIGNNSINNISISVRNPSNINSAESQIAQLLRENHDISLNSEDGFYIKTQLNVIKRILKVSKTMTILLGLIASISLIVGGIGIMNIMLVSVIERTKEIGIRMAVGAKQKDILIQFVAEAMMLSVIGGMFGIMLGIIASKISTFFTQWPSTTSLSAILIAFVFSALVGVFFGYYPAKKASTLNPIEALRYE